jgi:hypothetical protein
MHRLQQARGQAIVRDQLSPVNALRALAPAMSHACRKRGVRRRTSPINIQGTTMGGLNDRRNGGMLARHTTGIERVCGSPERQAQKF